MTEPQHGPRVVPTHTVVVPDDVPMVSLLGPRDELLRTIERAFPQVDVHVRGNEFRLTGDTGEIALVERLARQRKLTVLFTEHDMDVVFSVAQNIRVLHQGRIIAEGRPDEIRGHPEVKRVYLGEGALAGRRARR